MAEPHRSIARFAARCRDSHATAACRSSAAVILCRPESRAVRRQHLVDQEDSIICAAPELELGIRDDNAGLRRSRLALGVDRAGSPLQLAGHLRAENPAHVCNRDVLVVSGPDLDGGANKGVVLVGGAGRERIERQCACLVIFVMLGHARTWQANGDRRLLQPPNERENPRHASALVWGRGTNFLRLELVHYLYIGAAAVIVFVWIFKVTRLARPPAPCSSRFCR